MELVVYTFAESRADPQTGETISPEQRVRNLLEEIELAEQVGLDVFGVGEHHRPDFVVSAPAVVLGAAAVRTERIRLTSAVTVLSSDDPVRVFEEYATLDLVSGGRAEIMAGRGSFIESFPLFGYDLADYDELFAEKLELLLELRDSVRVTWSGKHRAPLDDVGVYPRPVQEPLPRPLPRADQRRHDAARKGHARYRAPRYRAPRDRGRPRSSRGGRHAEERRAPCRPAEHVRRQLRR